MVRMECTEGVVDVATGPPCEMGVFAAWLWNLLLKGVPVGLVDLSFVLTDRASLDAEP
jgi:hypothetical protein